MSLFTKNKLGNFVRGGQTTIHYARMVIQVIKQFTWITFLMALALYVLTLYYRTSPQERQLAIDYSAAWYHAELFKDGEIAVNFHLDNGKAIKTTAANLLKSKSAKTRINSLILKAENTVYYSLVAWFFLIIFFVKFIYGTGRGHKQDEHVRGGLLVTMKELKLKLKLWLKEQKAKEGTLELLGVKLPKDFEPAHILIAGDPGTGKSNLLRQCFKSIRNAKQRAIIYDRSGDFAKNFYRPGVDVILNPLDERGADWDIFSECSKDYEFYELACSFIPDVKSNDPFWTLAARIIFSSMAYEESKKSDPSVSRLIKNIINSGLDELIEHCEGTDAQAIITKGGEKMAISVRGVLVTYVVSLKYLKRTKGGFSIKKWVNDDSSDSWIFITSKRSIHKTIKPLITSWLDIATSSILSLKPDLNRRIWISIDELPTLHKVPSIQETPAESRKYGGCFIIGFQNFPQLLDIYGKNGADSLCGSCSTSVIFRCNDTVFAKWGSEQLGRAEMVETTEGISFGANEIRDGVNLGKQKRERSIVLATELQNLPDLHGYLKIGRGFPVATFEDKYLEMEMVTEGFIERKDGAIENVEAISIVEEIDSSNEEYFDSWVSNGANIATKSAPKMNDAWQIDTDLTFPPTTKTQDKKGSNEDDSNDTQGAVGFLRGGAKKPKPKSGTDGTRNANITTEIAEKIDHTPDLDMD
ncbi:type IV conjugative transfer system coupling protein TraD [Pseudoalteromonas galatheae]|uniref:type IV conjugative transfer system coupling protein TraD n=1 Tax=Pseudoalteromonas galatheae TaxID=579562 RepID=UPI0030CD8BC4